MRNGFTAIVEPDGAWFVAYCAEVPGANGKLTPPAPEAAGPVLLPNCLQAGCSDAAVTADHRSPKIYGGRRRDPIRHVRNVGARDLAHGINDFQCERGLLENVVRVGDGGFQIRIGVRQQAVVFDEVDDFRQTDGWNDDLLSRGGGLVDEVAGRQGKAIVVVEVPEGGMRIKRRRRSSKSLERSRRTCPCGLKGCSRRSDLRFRGQLAEPSLESETLRRSQRFERRGLVVGNFNHGHRPSFLVWVSFQSRAYRRFEQIPE